MLNRRLLLIVSIMIYIFSPTIYAWMTNPEGSWFRPYIIWGLVIAITFAYQRRSYRNGD